METGGKKTFTTRDLKVNGRDIMSHLKMEMGGPIIGQISNKLLSWVLEDPKRNTKDQLLAKTTKIYNELS